MEKNEIPVLLLTGYLGSGKTTLLNRILTNRRGIRFAVIVNDIGEVNIDAALIQKGGVVGSDSKSGDLVALQNGCICCTLQTDLIEQLMGLASAGNFDYIVVEASGICDPAPIAQTIDSISRMIEPGYTGAIPVLDCIVTVVDALRLQSEFGCGEKLVAHKPAEEDIESLVIQQIEFCNVVLLNKISEVTPQEGERIRAIIRALQPKAKIIECDYAEVDLDEIVGTGMFDFEDVATSATWIRKIEHRDEDEEEEHDHHHHYHDLDEEEEGEHDDHVHHHHEHGEGCTCGHCHHHHHHHGGGHAEEYGIETMVYYRRLPFDLSKFDRFVATSWSSNIIRAKGILYFAHHRDMCYLFEQAGVQKGLTESGLWYATAPQAEIDRLMASDPTLRKDWDPEFGDRMVKLVFIGQHLDKDALTASLDACLSRF
ncbi:MAG: GTP-binding protein [Bacteroidales bacterium]|nr:GTP-binding protein [Bacteroidales bacterium]